MTRVRHPSQAYSRPTHNYADWDAADPSEPLYGSEMDLEPVTVVDIGQGSITDGAIDPGGLTGTIVIKPGTINDVQFDHTAPPRPDSLMLTSFVDKKTTGEEYVSIKATVDHCNDADIAGTWIQLTRWQGAEGEPDWTLATKVYVSVAVTSVVIENVMGNESYWGRCYSVDVLGNTSQTLGAVNGYMPAFPYPLVTTGDTDPPTIPEIQSVTAGFRSLGVRWSNLDAPDIRFYQVRWSDDAGSTWSTPIEVQASSYVITGLDWNSTYTVAVRCVDQSGNVDNGSGVAVDYLDNPNAGWTTSAGHTPLSVGTTDIAVGMLDANVIAAGTINTAHLAGETITVKQSGNYALGFRVLSSGGDELGIWDWNGLTIRDPADPANRFIRLDSGSLKLYTDGENAVSAITPDGIDATRVNFGAAPGGMNIIANASMELSTLTGSTSTATHTSDTQWVAGNRHSATNVVTAAPFTSITIL